MVDREGRDIGASVLRDFIDGEITNEVFASRFPKSSDPAVRAVFYFAWGQYSDLRVHMLTGRDTPTPERHAILERCASFLRTDLEFEWPVPKPSIWKGISQAVGLGRLFRASEEKYRSKGDFEVWPFLRKTDYESFTNRLVKT
jgi:hypothetical protein